MAKSNFAAGTFREHLPEMSESPDELANRWPLLSPLLVDCQPLNDAWMRWDANAKRLKRTHGIIVVIAAVFGTLAVVLAIWQLSLTTVGEETRFLYATIEFIVAAITLAAVVAGIRAELDQRWILERCRAEQCRFVKFAFLRQASYWLLQAPTARGAFVQKCLAELQLLEGSATRDYVRNELELSFEEDRWLDDTSGSGALVGQLRDLWLEKRIVPQMEFFHRRAKSLSKSATWTRRLLPLLFFLSLLFAGIHFAIDASLHWSKGASEQHAQTKDGPHTDKVGSTPPKGGAGESKGDARVSGWTLIARISLLMAASLPVLALGLRSLRSAFEFDRNENRFHGLHKRLDSFVHRLPPNVTAQQFSRVSAATEQTLKDEHRSWVRLMIEAEWF